ncbi:phage XkdN-like protein [Lachnoanaerobaculum saburreum F0468]|uniref:Phage XkdN-like protein n=1 Tax=Lachnoanaerobaculum saburreum F0468 TaxID=1095750 RepID=I0R7P0_9FIRM|nr:phage XkdN-like protein [Lachnoanaerobaculum saburreum]EIC95698.1 phage XkdN-like protein [Lachnoanaerobaculum saburreum F0468]
MNNSLMEKLMKLDRDKLMEVPTEKIKAKALSRIAGEDVEITVKALSGSLYTELMSKASNDEGGIDGAKIYDAYSIIVVKGCVEPNLKDEGLQKHYNAASPKDLAQILFPGGELTKIAEKIGALSGFGVKGNKEDKKGIDYDDVKNL